jgi:hypothetical protein
MARTFVPAASGDDNNTNNDYTFLLRGLGVYLDHLVNDFCSGYSVFAQ